jgi:hypothetical protein
VANPQRTIRRIEPAANTVFDEQLWPTNLALFILAGLTSSVVVLAGGFNDPRLLHNGWFRVATLGLTLAGFAVAANTLSPRRARRMQMAVFTSLVLHVLLSIFLYYQYLRHAKAEDESLQSPTEVRELTMPQYVEVIDPTTPRPFDEPVAASVDVEAEYSTDASRSQSPRIVTVQGVAPQEPQMEAPAMMRQERQVARAAPRQSQTASRISRQTQEAVAQASPPALARAARRVEVNEPPQLQTAAAELARQRSEQIQPQTSADASATALSETATDPARRVVEEDQPQVTIAAAESRRATAAGATTTMVEVVPKAQLAESAEEQLDAARDTTPRQAPQQFAEAREAPPDRSVAVSESTSGRERQETPLEPDVALAQVVEPNRQREPAEISADATELAASRRPSERTTETARQAANAAPTALARSSQQDPAADPRIEPANDSGGAAIAAAPRDATRARQQNAPSLAARTASAEPRRTVQPADAVASPATAQTAQAATSNQTEQAASVQPAQLAVARAAEGAVGGETGRNLADDLPSTTRQSAPQPSTAARRPSATDRSEGPALSPSSPVRIARTISEADAPAMGAAAAPVETAESAGSAEPSRVVASAGATVERASAAAPLAPVVAAEGTSSADLGAEQRVPDAGERRAGGGGEPEISVAAALPARQTTAASGAPHAAIDTQAIAELPSAPATSGQAAATQSQTVDASLTPGGRVAPSMVVHTEVFDGGAASSATAGEIAPSNLRRERTASASPGLNPGGGTDSLRRRATEGAVARSTAALPAQGAPAPSQVAQRTPTTPGPSGAASVARSAAGGGASSAREGRPSSSGGEVADDGTGPALAAVAAAGSRRAAAAAPQPRTSTAGPSRRSVAPAALPDLETSPSDLTVASALPGSGSNTSAEAASIAPNATSPIGRAEMAVAVDISAPIDEGGLAIALADAAGSPDRRAQPHSELVRVEPDRFLRRRAGGLAALGGDVRAPAPAFARRSRRDDIPSRDGAGRPSAKTEAAIELGLVYLARHQRTDGRWSLAYNGVDLARTPRERPTLQADTAATGLALLAYLGAAYDHYGDKYQDVVDRGLRFLIENQKEDGDLYIEEDAESNKFNHLYSHGIAAIALCEAYGMTGDPALKAPAQRAIDFIVASQHSEHGGWRYEPGDAGFSSDLSVTGWQMMALKSGQLAGLDVPEKTYDNVRRFVTTCADNASGGSRFVYNPWAAEGTREQQHGARPSTVMTSVGLLMELYLGSDRNDAVLKRGADHLLANPPTLGNSRRTPQIGTLGNPMRDTYYWYYATQVMFHMKGEHWQKWNEALHPLLVNSQSQTGRLAGSWNPHAPVRDQWAPHAGRLYVTAMNLLSLEVYYRHLPLYDETGR